MADPKHPGRRIVPIARDGWRFVAPVVALGLAALVFELVWAALVFLALALAIGSFFRDPERRVPRDPEYLLSPADGRVVGIEEMEVPGPEGEPVRVRRVGIVLSIFNAHVQRAPTYCTVASVRYNPGKFINAFNDKSSDENENNMIWMQSGAGPIGVRQIAGLVARRVLCWCEPGEHLMMGQRIGLIRFGSRTEAFLPLEVEIEVRVGQKVKAGLSILGRLSSEPVEAAPSTRCEE
jgi:phosphatidylserine decarboxylase